MTQLAREGACYTAQAFQRMRPARRRVILVATLRELEVTLTDAAISMFASLVGRSHLRARKKLDQRIAASVEEGRERLPQQQSGALIADVVNVQCGTRLILRCDPSRDGGTAKFASDLIGEREVATPEETTSPFSGDQPLHLGQPRHAQARGAGSPPVGDRTASGL